MAKGVSSLSGSKKMLINIIETQEANLQFTGYDKHIVNVEFYNRVTVVHNHLQLV